jgi:DNA-binding NtrC family response regulator
VARIIKVARVGKDGFSMVVEGLARFRLDAITQVEPFFTARLTSMLDEGTCDVEINALAVTLKNIACETIDMLPEAPVMAKLLLESINTPGHLADLIIANTDFAIEEKQEILEAVNLKVRLTRVFELLSRKFEAMKIRQRVRSKIEFEVSKVYREYDLRKQLQATDEELREIGERADESQNPEHTRRRYFLSEQRKVIEEELCDILASESATREERLARNARMLRDGVEALAASQPALTALQILDEIARRLETPPAILATTASTATSAVVRAPAEGPPAAKPRHAANRSAAVDGVSALIGNSFRVNGQLMPLHQARRKARVGENGFLVAGSPGSRLELAARRLLGHDGPTQTAIVVVPCAGLPPSVLEREIFGFVPLSRRERGFASGGLLAEADAGALVLQDIDALTLPLQERVLRLLYAGSYLPVGGDERQTFTGRIVGTTRRDFAWFDTAGAFREALFARLGALIVEILPLRDRLNDVPAAIHALLARRGLPATSLTADELRPLAGRQWAQDIDELEAAVIDIVSRREDGEDTATAHDLPPC